jgi:hypothetical protein
MNRCKKAVRVTLLVALVLGLSGCEQPQVYGSIGYSSWGGGGLGGSISVGGRIF